MPGEPLISYGTLFGFLFALARISGVVAFLPLAGVRALPEPVRVLLSLALTLVLWPEWKASFTGDATLGRVVAGIASEAALGLVIGLAVAIACEAFQLAAQVASQQAGFSYASTVDPASGADSTVLLTLAQLTAGLLFFVSGADRLLIRALADSLRICPPESFALNGAMGRMMIHFAASIFSAGLRLALPVITLLLMADITLAVLSRVQAQLQLITLTLPVKLGIALVMLSLILPFQPRVFENLMGSCLRLIEATLRSGR